MLLGGVPDANEWPGIEIEKLFMAFECSRSRFTCDEFHFIVSVQPGGLERQPQQRQYRLIRLECHLRLSLKGGELEEKSRRKVSC